MKNEELVLKFVFINITRVQYVVSFMKIKMYDKKVSGVPQQTDIN